MATLLLLIVFHRVGAGVLVVTLSLGPSFCACFDCPCLCCFPSCVCVFFPLFYYCYGVALIVMPMILLHYLHGASAYIITLVMYVVIVVLIACLVSMHVLF